MRKFIFAVLFSATLCVFADVANVAKSLADKIPAGTITYQEGAWLYSKNEFLHLAKGNFASGNVKNVSACINKKNADPLPTLVFFNNELKKRGIKLILLPIPPKAAFYPPAGMKKYEAMNYLKSYYSELKSAGIEVVDISDAFAKANSEVFCKTDSHWSPAGIECAADLLADKIGIRGDKKFENGNKEIEISGDLAKGLGVNAPKEKINVRTVNSAISQESPVLVIGDSHTLIFSTGSDMLAENGGLCENLADKLQMPVDRIGIKGSAATAVRINLFRKASRNPGWLKNKKVLIYCFSSREFTEAVSGWAKVPVAR